MRSRFKGLAGWLKNSFVDFPGTVSTVLFFSGCNLRCPYCHNGSLILAPEDMSVRSDEVWDFLEKRANVIKGVVFSGGEPTLHENIISLCAEVRALGYRIKLDTNGLLPEMIERCAPDYVALDIKTTPEGYGPLLLAPYSDVAARLSRSLALVKKMGTNAEVRITMAPPIITEEIVLKLRSLLDGVAKVYLQPLNLKNEVLNPQYFQSVKLYTPEETGRFRALLEPVVGMCRIRNE